MISTVLRGHANERVSGHPGHRSGHQPTRSMPWIGPRRARYWPACATACRRSARGQQPRQPGPAPPPAERRARPRSVRIDLALSGRARRADHPARGSRRRAAGEPPARGGAIGRRTGVDGRDALPAAGRLPPGVERVRPVLLPDRRVHSRATPGQHERYRPGAGVGARR